MFNVYAFYIMMTHLSVFSHDILIKCLVNRKDFYVWTHKIYNAFSFFLKKIQLSIGTHLFKICAIFFVLVVLAWISGLIPKTYYGNEKKKKKTHTAHKG